ncbi:uncharacterized protein LOC127879139 isoform X2 [Dreissena polymorpha]|uniref:uncharacterized protein LOC127879139 isoform X2 n=1 Tax=Dreissena polymorpha TaxID=45954 RepID=UPI002264F4EA|nr:uncharacterized protein LOC127879139 isoform X2 [Dreissena polymorpha]
MMYDCVLSIHDYISSISKTSCKCVRYINCKHHHSASMIPLVEAKRTLLCVRLATGLVRVLSCVNILAGIVSLCVDVETFFRIGFLISGSAGLTQPLLMACVYSNQPSPNYQQTSICMKYILYVWLFILNLAVVPCVLLSLEYIFTDERMYTPQLSIFLAIVVFVTCFILTMINMYTFCILHKNGLCFLYSLNKDVEHANVPISFGSARITASTPPDDTSMILPPPYSVAVSNPGDGSDCYV